MMACTISREDEGERAIYRVRGAFERANAWALRERIEHDPAASVIIDFTLVGDCSDLAIAIVAHGIVGATRPVTLRGLRHHQTRILRYCGVPLDGTDASQPPMQPATTAAEQRTG